jgi:hypothetical protein
MTAKNNFLAKMNLINLKIEIFLCEKTCNCYPSVVAIKSDFSAKKDNLE